MHLQQISLRRPIHVTYPLCIKSTHIGSLFWLTLQLVGINRMRTHTNKVYFDLHFNWLSCQFAEKWALLPFLSDIKFFSNKSLEYESLCLINWFIMIWFDSQIFEKHTVISNDCWSSLWNFKLFSDKLWNSSKGRSFWNTWNFSSMLQKNISLRLLRIYTYRVATL